jgi:hypothetical protein
VTRHEQNIVEGQSLLNPHAHGTLLTLLLFPIPASPAGLRVLSSGYAEGD